MERFTLQVVGARWTCEWVRLGMQDETAGERAVRVVDIERRGMEITDVQKVRGTAGQDVSGLLPLSEGDRRWCQNAVGDLVAAKR